MIETEFSPKRRAYAAFSENIETRGDHDLIINMVPLLLVLLMPLAIYCSIWYGPELLPSIFSRFDYITFSENIVVVLILVQSLIVIVVLWRLYRRLISHFERDVGWRRALIDYARADGGDVSELERLDGEAVRMGRFYGKVPAQVCLVLTYLIVFAFFFYILPQQEDHYVIYHAMTLGIILAAVIFFSVLTEVLIFPYRHERNQAEFLDEFGRTVGMDLPRLQLSMKYRPLYVHIILMVATLGLYLLYLLAMAFTSMNKHIRNQWTYEDWLMSELGMHAGMMIGTPEASAKPVRRSDRMPLTLVLAEIFMIFIVGYYTARLVGVVIDIDINPQLYDITMLGENLQGLPFREKFRAIVRYFMVIWYVYFLGVTIEAMMALVSHRAKAWRNVVRSCVTFAVPTWIASWLYNPDSFTHLFDLNPYVTTAVLYVMLLFLVISVDVRRFYTPTTMDVPDSKVWLKFALHGTLRENAEGLEIKLPWKKKE